MEFVYMLMLTILMVVVVGRFRKGFDFTLQDIFEDLLSLYKCFERY